MNSKIIRALSIRQPFVELILQGKKMYEYRLMSTNLRERIYIYASLQQGGLPEDQQDTGKTFEELQKGLVVGTVEITDCQWDDKSNCYAYKLDAPIRLEKALNAVNQPNPRFWIPKFA